MNRTLLSDNLPETTIIEPKQIIGTKWNSWCDSYRNQVSVEFVDRTNCIYTAEPRKYPTTYIVADGKIFITNITGTFELRGNILFNNDLPAFEKAA